jgi:hypothetical protein
MRSKPLHNTIKLLVLIYLFSHNSLLAVDYSKIINHINQTPANVINSTKKLSTYLCAPFKTETEKFASIYYWIAKNISYNHDLASQPLYYENIDEIIDHVMQKKDGVCQHYSELFAALSRQAGLTTYVIGGYTRSNNEIDELSHAWNIINAEGKWYFVDVTWAGSSVQSSSKNKFPEDFFMLTPAESIKNRMPFDPIWQALSHPLKYQEFDRGLVNDLKKGTFNFNDSIQKHVHLSQAEQFDAITKRMGANGIQNELVRKEYALMKENYRMLLYNQDVEKYNQASTYYNKGMQAYNNYARLKNNKTAYLKKTKKELLELVDSTLINLNNAHVLFSSINKGSKEMNAHLEKNEQNIEKIINLMRREKKLVNDNF